MPVATVDTEPQRFELQSAPPDGFVLLRRMSHGQMLHRQDIAMTMNMQADRRTSAANVDIKQSQTAVGMFELAVCVVDHNLTDPSGRKLNFTNRQDVEQLDGRVGAEINMLIQDMHDWEKSDPNSSPKSTESSSTKESPDLAEATSQTPLPADLQAIS